jgi:hypothetical protein
MRTKFALAAALTTALLMPLGATAANADTYQDPLTRGNLVIYNHDTYALSIKPVAGSEQVARYGHKVASTYTVRVIESAKSGDKVLYSGKLGYYRTAYARLKLVDSDSGVVRDYGIKTYMKKVTAFSADYAKKRVQDFTVKYRHRTLVLDVKGTVNQVESYIQEHGSLAGVQNDPNVVIKSDPSYFGYQNAKIRIFVDPKDSSNKTYQVYGFDPTDKYSSLYDSESGKVRSGITTEQTAYLPE